MLYLPLRTVKYIQSEFEKKFEKYNFESFIINDFQKCVVIEDSLVLYIGIFSKETIVCSNVEEKFEWVKNNQFMDLPKKGDTFYGLYIEELTYNTLGFKYNHTKFIEDIYEKIKINSISLDIEYRKFKGYTRTYWAPEKETLIEEIDKLIPALNLRERYKSWEGVNYNFIIMKMALNGESHKYEYAVSYTSLKPHSYILSKGNEWLKRGSLGGDFRQNGGFVKAFNSWKGVKRQFRLENYFKYFSINKYFKEKDDVWRYADQVLERAYQGEFDSFDFINYYKPKNKWKSEELVYNIIKKHFKEHVVIYQHRPFFLKSDIGGQMSYDVFIAGLNIAIEYQGKQHFEPVEFFGGIEAFNRNVVRDKIKRRLSEQNKVKIVFINYWEDISPTLIIGKIEKALE